MTFAVPALLSLKLVSAAMVFAFALPAVAQNSTNAPPPSAKSEGGGTPQGDPSGAVRALGSAETEHGKGTVTVPNVGSGGDGHTGGVPAGTAR